MKSWVCNTLTGESGLSLETRARPACGADQVRVRNHAAALNFPDTLITRGLYQLALEPPFVPGSEFAGTITEVGDNVAEFRVGQRVLALTGYAAFSEEVLVTPPGQQLHRIPDGMPFTDAAGLTLTYGTAIHALTQRGRLKRDETLLVLGSAGGCGSAAVQIGAAMGARVIAAASTDAKCRTAREMGATDTINYGTEDLRTQLLRLTDGAGADVIFDPVGGSLFDQAKRCAAWNGRYLVVGFAAGDIPQLGINYTILKSISVTGVAYGMSAIKDPATNITNINQLFDWYTDGRIRPLIGSIYPLEALPDACAALWERRATGKTVITFAS
ncbi:NADPH:quinone oxidoreductase family protein [Nocardia jiangxiensis]|uniref:NADPH:quinone oxidoreductase family protein n=1 Tax=Nocardia jiangxiensis TaxID=282685 RepID=A0ABW6RX75_9NOCA|nr:NADPH:quinone oxidoreductase family protein [Nocardia jiangxiensis]